MKQDKGVALKYNTQKKIPEIIAIAKGQLLTKMLELAKKNNITIYKDKDSVEILSAMNVGRQIPEELYKVIAEILSFCYKVSKNFREKIDKIDIY